jgi:UDP-glucose 4-epimerase
VKILITGSSGFVGGSVGRFAAAAGHRVLGLSRNSQPTPGWPAEHHCVDVSQADLSPVMMAFSPDVIFHAAGTASVASSVVAPLDDFRAAVVSWSNLLDAVRRSGLRPTVIFPSSAAVYGNTRVLPIREDAPTAPISPYGFHKLACELLAREYSECFGLSVIIVRVFSLFGPAQRRMLVWEIYNQAMGPTPEIQLGGTGQETRDFLHVEDFARIVMSLMRTGEPGTLNVASGADCSVLDLCKEIQQVLGTKKSIRCGGYHRPGDPLRWRADISQMVSRLGDGSSIPRLGDSIGRCIRSWAEGRTW